MVTNTASSTARRPEEERRGRLKLLVAPNGPDRALHIHQDARIYTSILDEAQSVHHVLEAGRGAWLQVARGSVDLSGVKLRAGDGARIEISGASDGSEILLLDLS